MSCRGGSLAPAARAVELGDERGGVFDADLVDPVFVAVEGEQAAVAAKDKARRGEAKRLRRDPGTD